MTKAAATQAAPPPRQLQVLRGRVKAPLRILLGGVEGIGKTTWGAKTPAPIFISVEAGTEEMDVQRFVFETDSLKPRTQPATFAEVLGALRDLAELVHDYRTVVVDTVDALEALIWRSVCVKGSKANIEEFGYGKGYVAALDEWRLFLSALERLRRERDMNIVLIAHTHIKTFKNPEGDDYDRYELKLHTKAGGLLKEWVSDVFFAHYETYAVKSSSDERKAKGIATGARIIGTVRTAAWDAKNRHGLPPTMPLDFAAFVAAVEHRADPDSLRRSIDAKLAALGDASVTAKVTPMVASAGDDVQALIEIDDRMTATLEQRRSKGA